MNESILAECLILSRKRPAQLDLLLESIDRFASHLFSTVTILYKADDPGYRDGYALTQERWPDREALYPSYGETRYWIEEIDFERDIRTWIAGTHTDSRTIMFLTDDAVFYRYAVRPRPSTLPYAYRLAGPNNWRDHPQYGASEEGYPLTIVGTSYKRSMLEPLLGFPFPNPTALEAGLAAQATSFEPDVIYGPDKACLCMINANRVSSGSNMPHMDIDPAGMNWRYLGGERLDLDGIDFTKVDPTSSITMLEMPWKATVAA